MKEEDKGDFYGQSSIARGRRRCLSAAERARADRLAQLEALRAEHLAAVQVCEAGALILDADLTVQL